MRKSTHKKLKKTYISQCIKEEISVLKVFDYHYQLSKCDMLKQYYVKMNSQTVHKKNSEKQEKNKKN